MDYNDVITRNIGVLTVEEQEKIKDTTVVIVGLGGIGSSAAVLTAKSGFGHIIVVDKDLYELHNLSLQMLATTETINLPKAKVAEDILPLHNPFMEVKAITMDIQTVEEVKQLGIPALLFPRPWNGNRKTTIKEFLQQLKVFLKTD